MMPMNTNGKGAILAVPADEQGRGGGHLSRCMSLVRDLRNLGREAWLYASRLPDTGDFNRQWIVTREDIPAINWECILLDRFKTLPEELERWKELAPVIGIDEGGINRSNFDFLIDILPNNLHITPNISDPSLIIGNKRVRRVPHEECNEDVLAQIKILISFGHEDSAGLGIATAQALVSQKTDTINITLIQGGLSNPNLSFPTSHVTIIKSIPNLSEHLLEYDLVITHYGLTAFESLYAGVPVLLLSPGAYHEKLAKSAGFYSVGIGKKGASKLSGIVLNKGKFSLSFYDRLKKRCTALTQQYNLDKTPQHSLTELINSFSPDINHYCPVCGKQLRSNVIARFPDRSYCQCTHCGIISMNRLKPQPIEYGREYFFKDYQKQYGKTYLEDFPHLTAMGKQRLMQIKKLLTAHNHDTVSLLDIGCAFGPFLAAAQEQGFSPYGIDPSKDAVDYVTQTLGIPAIQGFFPFTEGSAEQKTCLAHYDVITLWFVIEHFRNCVPALKDIHKMLSPGGILAFSTPSFSGISGRSSLLRFLEHSPADHWTVWSPSVCKKALRIAGFNTVKIVNCGHHPERFPFAGKLADNKKNPLYRLLLAISEIFSLGDTFEVYAVKN